MVFLTLNDSPHGIDILLMHILQVLSPPLDPHSCPNIPVGQQDEWDQDGDAELDKVAVPDDVVRIEAE